MAWSTPPDSPVSSSRADERDTLVNDGDLQTATAKVATVGTGARSPRARHARLDGGARHDVRAHPRCHPAQPRDVRCPHAPRAFGAGGVCPGGGPVRRGSDARGGQARRADQRRQRPRGLRARQRARLPLRRAPAAGRFDRALADGGACLPPRATPPGPSAASPAAGSAPSRPAITPIWCSSARIRWRTSTISKRWMGDARRQDLAAGTASERDRDAVARADPRSLPAAIGSRPTPSTSPRRSAPGDSRAGTAG